MPEPKPESSRGSQRLLRRLLWIAVAILGFAIVMITTIEIIGRTDYLRRKVEAVASHSLGTKVTIKHLEISMFWGADLRGIESDLASIGSLRMVYGFFDLFALRLRVSEAIIEDFQIRISCVEGSCNHDQILERLKADKSSPPPSEVSKSSISLSQIRDLFAWLNAPLMIELESIGIKDLDLQIQVARGTRRESFVINDFNVLMSAGLGRGGLGFDLAVGAKSPAEYKVGVGTNITHSMSGAVGIKTRLKTEGNMMDWHLNAEASHLQLDGKKLESVVINGQANVLMNWQKEAVTIERLQFAVADFAKFELKAAADLSKMIDDVFGVSMQSSLSLKLDQLNPWLSIFGIPVSVDGTIVLDAAMPETRFDQALMAAVGKRTLPPTEGKVRFDGLRVVAGAKDADLNLNNLSAELSWWSGEGREQRTPGQFSEIELNTSINSLSIQQSRPVRRNAAITNLRLGTKALLKPLQGAVVGGDYHISAPSIAVESKETGKFRTDLTIDGKVNWDDLRKIDANLSLGNLLGLEANAAMDSSGRAVSTALRLKISSLEKVLSAVSPVVTIMGQGQLLPRRVTGAIEFDASAAVSGLDAIEVRSDRIVRPPDSSANFSAALKLIDVGFEDGQRQLQVDGFSADLSSTGDWIKQRVKLSMRNRETKLVQAGSGSAKSDVIGINGLLLKVDLSNRFADAEMRFSKTQSELVVNQEMQELSYFGKSHSLQTPVHFAFDASQKFIEVVALQRFELKVPGLGLAASAAGRADLNEHFVPRTGSARVALSIENSGVITQVAGMQTSGRLDFECSAESQGEQRFAIDGELAVKEFSFASNREVPGQGVFLKNLSGAFPFRQSVDIGRLKRTMLVDAVASKKDEEPDLELKSADLEALITEYLSARSEDAQVSPVVLDFKSHRPASPKHAQLFAELMEIKGIGIQNIELDLEMKQNYLAINEFNASVLGGTIQGSTYFAFNEISPKLNTAWHFTRINTRNLLDGFPKLKRNAAAWNLMADPNIAGTLALGVDLSNRELNGRIELTEIGLEQLRMLLYYLDPKQKDPSIKSIIQILNASKLIAGIDRVSIPIESGLIDVIIDMRVVGAPIPLPKIRQFPIGTLITNLISEQNAVPKDKT